MRIVRVGVCLLAGAVVTWAVAWGCALWGEGPRLEFNLRPVEPRVSAFVPAYPEDQGWIGGRTRVRTKTLIITALDDDVLPATEAYDLQEFGWPARGMLGRTKLDYGDQIVLDTYLAAPSWMGPGPDCPGLPTEVLPLGFALNTLLAAGVLMGVVETFAWARRRGRRRRGRCPACGYDRRGLAGGDAAACPECGAGGGR